MPCAGQARDQTAADEAGGAGDQHRLPPRQFLDKAGRGHAVHSRQTFGRGEIPQAAKACADSRCRGNDTEQAGVSRCDRGRQHRPADQYRQQQHENGAVVDREQRVIDAFARRQFPAHVLFDEIHQRDDDFRDQHRDDEHRKNAVHFEPAEHQKQKRVEHVAQRMELQFVSLRGTPRQPLGQLMVIEGVEHPHHDLNGDQGPKQRRHDAASRNTAD